MRHVTVPLNKSLWPSESKDKKFDDKLESEEESSCSGDENLRRKESELFFNEESDLASHESRRMEEISENVKDDLEKAVDMGDKLQYRMEEENERKWEDGPEVFSDVETYHADNMDDLFDKEEED